MNEVKKDQKGEKTDVLNKLNARKKPNFFSLIKKDLARYPNVASALYSTGFWIVFLYRISHFLQTNHLEIISIFIQGFNTIVFGCDISRKLKAGPGLCILHARNIFIGPFVTFGAGVTVNQGCFFGAFLDNHNENTNPVLDDWVYVSPGAKVIGNIVIGERSVVGPNCVVLKNIPPNYTVLPPQVHIIKKYELNKPQ